jgi:PAS domain S-box-containing protein
MLEEANLIRDERGNPLEIVGYWTDITLQKKIEELLRNERENFYNILNSTNDRIYIVNSQFEIEFVNAALEREFGYVEGRTCYEYFNKFDEMCSWCTIKEVLDGETVRWEKTRTQNQKTYDIIDTPFRNLDGSISLLSILRDITERKQTEEALCESEAKYRNLVERANDGIAIVKENKLVLVNKKLTKMLGSATEELLNKDYTCVIHPDAIPMIKERYQAYKAGKDLPSIYESKLKKKDGTALNVELNVGFIDYQGDKTATLSFVRDITKRKQAEEQLQYQANLLTYVSDAVIASDLDFRITSWNKAAEGIYGWQEEEVLGEQVGQLLGQEYPYDRREDVIKNFMRKGVWQGEVIQKRKDGTTINVLASVTLVKDDTGRPIAALAVNRDITERIQTKYALQESEEKYRSLVELANDGIVIIRDMKLEFINRQAAEMLGYTVEELLGISFAKVVHPDGLNGALEIYQRRMAGHNVPSRYEMKLLRKDGAPLDVEINVRLITYQDSTAELAMARDITERKQAEKALRESEERLRKFMESATNGFTLLDSDLNFIDMNKEGLGGLGLSKDEVVGKNLLDIFPALRNTERFDKYLEVIKTGIPYDSDDIFSTPRLGDKYFSVRAFKVGEGLGVITTDITDRMRAEKTREELEQRRDSFVWMTSHELRTPLTVLTGYCDFLIEHLNDLAQKRITNILGVMKSNLDRLERLTSKVSTIGQIQRGSFEIEKTSMNLCDFLQDTLEPYHQLLGNQFEFQGCLEDSSIIIAGDAHRLQQVLDNIVGNAIKQTDKDHRRIRVTSKIGESHIKIVVSDNGAGIEPENLEVIFDQFVSIPTEFSATGTGIGLYLCRKTLEAHGGRITAQSKGQGLGATFIIEIPRTNTVESQKF